MGSTSLGACLSSVVLIKTLTKNNLGRKGFVWLTGSSLSSEEAKAGIQRQDVERRP